MHGQKNIKLVIVYVAINSFLLNRKITCSLKTDRRIAYGRSKYCRVWNSCIRINDFTNTYNLIFILNVWEVIIMRWNMLIVGNS